MRKSAPSTCSAASEGSASDSNEPDLFGQLPSASATSSAKPSSESIGPKSPSTTTSENLKETRNPPLQMELTSSAAGSRNCASPGVSPGSNEAQKMTAISGRRWLPLLKSYGLNGSLAKMSEALLTSRWASSAAFLTWKASGTKPRHLLFQLAPSMPRTDATGSGLWPTVTASQARSEGLIKGMRKKVAAGEISREEAEAMIGGSLEPARMGLWATPRTRDIADGRTLNDQGQRISKSSDLVFGANLADQVKMWPTPRSFSAMAANITEKTTRPEGYRGNLEEVVARTMWPTPTTRDYKGGRKPETLAASGRGEMNTLNDAVTVRDQYGSLNPTWVEWLMGYEVGWTDLGASEMPSSRKSSSGSEEQ